MVVAMMVAVVAMVAVVVVRMMWIQNADVRFALLQVSRARRLHDRLRIQNDRFLIAAGRGLVRIDQVRLALVGQADRQHTEQADDVQQDQLVHFGRFLGEKHSEMDRNFLIIELSRTGSMRTDSHPLLYLENLLVAFSFD